MKKTGQGTIEFGTYTPAQIAEHLKKLRPECLAEVLKCLAMGDQKAGVSVKASKANILVDAEPFKNTEGHRCGLCDSTHQHEHPQLTCPKCGEMGLAENMREHVCKGKTSAQVFGAEAEKKLVEKFAWEYSKLSQRTEQLSLNQRWLIERIDGIHAVLCPGRIATWQEHAIQSETAAHKLADACAPIIHFITQWERQPLRKSPDEFYGIHSGTEYEATLKLSDMAKLRDLLKPNK